MATVQSKAGVIKASLTFYIGTNLFYAAFYILPTYLIALFLPNLYVGFVLLICAPAALWFTIQFSAKQVHSVYEFDTQKVFRAAFALFIVINIGVVYYTKMATGAWYVSLADLISIANIIVYFVAAKKYLNRK